MIGLSRALVLLLAVALGAVALAPVPASAASSSSFIDQPGRTTAMEAGERAAVFVRAARPKIRNKLRPKVVGEQRFSRTLRATPGRWAPRPRRTSYQWMRSGKPISGATGRRYTLAPQDVNKRIRVRVTAKAAGRRPAAKSSAKPARVGHRVPSRRVVTYSVVTRGEITTSLKTFTRQTAQSLADPRGWRGGGTTFRRVRSGGDFSLVLSEARFLTSYSSGCSNYYSCRVGRFVIINQDRWKFATPPWRAGKRSLRDYRHMVLNHEVGHWLGNGHVSCGGPGQLSPVMAQQSKGTGGCRFNPWPLLGEY